MKKMTKKINKSTVPEFNILKELEGKIKSSYDSMLTSMSKEIFVIFGKMSVTKDNA